MFNPVNVAITNSTITPADLARKLQVTRQYIKHCQNAVVGKLSIKVIRWVADTLSSEDCPYLASMVIEDYEKYQDYIRIKEYIRLNEPGLPGSDESGSAFTTWRKKYYATQYAFSVAWCIHPSLVNFYESGTVKRMPKMMQEAFDNVRKFRELHP